MIHQHVSATPHLAPMARLMPAHSIIALLFLALVLLPTQAFSAVQGLYAQDPMVRISSTPIEKNLDQVLAGVSERVTAATGIEQKYITYYWQTIDAINCMGEKTEGRPIFVDLYVPGFFTDQNIADMMTAIADALHETVGIDKKWIFIHTLFPNQGQVYISGEVAIWDNYQGKGAK